MTLPIPEKYQDLFTRPILCTIITVSPDGSPHGVPVWCDFDGTYVRVNLRNNTKKVRDLQNNTKVCVVVIDPLVQNHWIEIQGNVSDLIDETHGAREHINQLSQKYMGAPYPFTFEGADNNRMMYLIEAVKINGSRE